MKEHTDVILGFDIGGTKCAAIVGRVQTGQVLVRVEIPTTPAEGFDKTFERICRAGDEALEAAKNKGVTPCKQIGVSIGGPLDVSSGIIYSPPNLPGWDNIPLKKLLEQRFALPVVVEHDGMAGAMAERAYGAARGVDHLIFLTLGTGLGAGLILGGRPYRGQGGAAGSVGHIRMADRGPKAWGKEGSWEAFSSGSGIASLARWQYPDLFPEDVTAKDVAEKAAAGHEPAQHVLSMAADYLGRGMAILVDILAPEMIVLGSLASRLGGGWMQKALDVLQKEAEPHALRGCRIVPSELGERIGDLAPLAAVRFRGNLVESTCAVEKMQYT